ncbi:MAG: M43 family zinc metalloprotease [Saprospiraceae bacterium]|nr:M43 family zinc metalloprotease [Saprospiraceae bacterium]
MTRIFFTLYFLLLLAACSPRLRSHFCTAEEVRRVPASEIPAEYGDFEGRSPCSNPLSYIPDTAHLQHTPIRHVRVNFHFMNSADSSSNYVGDKAVEFTRGWLHSANNDLKTNHKMWLPPRNYTPVIPTRYRYVLTPGSDRPDDDGIYFHFDNDNCYYIHKGKNRNLHERALIEKYALRPDSILNVFVMPHHPDSVASDTYRAGFVGVALGNSIKIAGMYADGGPPWKYRGVLNHEIGHVFGLGHTWAFNDGCEDTPRHGQHCWNRTEEPPCDTMASNNVMDYNALQNAWTPCQIGRVHYRMSRTNARARGLLRPDWCRLREDKHIFIEDTVRWQSAKDIESHITIQNGGQLIVECRLSLPKDGLITVRPGGTLILNGGRIHNSCGDRWQGIVVERKGRRRGQVIFAGAVTLENMIHPLEENTSRNEADALRGQ